MKLTCLLTLACIAMSLACLSVRAQTVTVNETFDSYADTSALNAVWTPDGGDGAFPIGQAGEIIPNLDTTNYPFGINNPPGITGKGVGNFGSINEFNGSAYSLFPSATQNVVVRGDIYIYDDGTVFDDPESLFDGEPMHNSRQTIGIRNDTLDRDITFGFQRGLNFLEMGTWNDSTCDATVSGCVTASSLTREEREANPGFRDLTQFGYRMALFSTYGDITENGVNKGPALTGPNWQYFQLDPALDLATTTFPNGNTGNGDGTANITDIGSGWHTFQATLKEGSILLELDLFRDGLNNVTGNSGIDASVEIETGYGQAPEIPAIGQVAGDAPFTSLRIGGPSGIVSLTEDETMNHPGVFDNIYLALEDVSAGLTGDFDLDGDVDGSDFLLWQRGGSPDPLSAGDLSDWQSNYGAPSSLAASASAVPEPSTLLMALGLAACSTCGRRRR